MSNRFFIKNAPLIILITISLVHLAGFLAEKYLMEDISSLVWGSVVIIDLAFGLRCGKLLQELYRGVFRDNLTGLKTREFFHSFLQHEIAKLEGNSSQISLIMIDIDDFKKVNDRYGHVAGDHVIKMVANEFKKFIRANDAAVRWGGEEFAIVLPGTSKSGAYKLAERLRKNVEMQSFRYKETSLNVTISLGVACVSEQITAEALVDLADQALYRAKSQKNRVSVCA
ncbi:GGDEF domain-containing protein [Dendrosporobacter sp. 1207_IL3150]|uniref:GGDEF domain-containing protein n=1 Tax=Dendrosporobacter sp. 1207_IL3150 TaxID=3084054 RepID=UPI002FD99B52